MKPPLVLLPPSEGKATGGSEPSLKLNGLSFPSLTEARKKVIANLDRLPDAAFGVKGAALEKAKLANAKVMKSKTLPALLRYTGVLYDALDAGSLTTKEKKRLNEQVVIFSGLFGAVAADDLLPDYKLKMSATLSNLGRLSSFWKPFLTDALAPYCEQQTVWNLLPNEHNSAWNPPTSARVITVKFLDDDGKGNLTTVSHWNKLLKGSLVRWLLSNNATEPTALKKFRHPENYRFSEIAVTKATAKTPQIETVVMVRK